MNILKISLFISVFLFSLTAFALERKENCTNNQMLAMNQVAFHQQNREVTLAATDAVHYQIMTQSPIQIQDVSFFTKLCILLIITMVYWIYWLINTRFC